MARPASAPAIRSPAWFRLQPVRRAIVHRRAGAEPSQLAASPRGGCTLRPHPVHGAKAETKLVPGRAWLLSRPPAFENRLALPSWKRRRQKLLLYLQPPQRPCAKMIDALHRPSRLCQARVIPGFVLRLPSCSLVLPDLFNSVSDARRLRILSYLSEPDMRRSSRLL